MDLNEISRLTSRWSSEVGRKINYCPPEAKVVTGDYHLDKQLYFFEQESGIAVKLTRTGSAHLITSYDIVDEEKFAWFMLRYT